MTTKRKKRCANCKDTKIESAFNKDKQKTDGLCSWCRECKQASKKYIYRDHARRNGNGNAITYKVIYDPCNTFGKCSEFTRIEVYEMLREDYLAIGTRFYRKRDKTYHHITREMKFEMDKGVTA
jgi:hypothetical protein